MGIYSLMLGYEYETTCKGIWCLFPPWPSRLVFIVKNIEAIGYVDLSLLIQVCSRSNLIKGAITVWVSPCEL